MRRAGFMIEQLFVRVSRAGSDLLQRAAAKRSSLRLSVVARSVIATSR
jgi:hypothetical protein